MPDWTVSDYYSADDLAGICALMAGEWWTKQREPETVRRSLEASQLVFTVTSRNGEIVGVARVLTDYTYLAVVLDVISSATHRGEGIGAALMDAITQHPKLQSVDSIELVCQPELQGFYSRWGFSSDVGRSGLMRRR